MSNYVIQAQTLTGIADAIRAQLGTEQQYTPESMAAAIRNIQGNTSIEDEFVSRTLSGDYENNRVTQIGSNAFSGTSGLTKVVAKLAVRLKTNAFQSCGNLEECIVPSATEVQAYCFNGCTSLTKFYAPLIIIGSNAFSASGLESLVIQTVSVCNLQNSSAFNNTPIQNGTGYIYVPDDLVDQYKVATNWATYASQIKGLSEIPAEVQEWLDQQGGASA